MAATIIAKSGTFLTGTGIVGTKIPIVGLGDTPKALIFTWNSRNTPGIGRQSVQEGRGIAASPTQADSVARDGWWVSFGPSAGPPPVAGGGKAVSSSLVVDPAAVT